MRAAWHKFEVADLEMSMAYDVSACCPRLPDYSGTAGCGIGGVLCERWGGQEKRVAEELHRCWHVVPVRSFRCLASANRRSGRLPVAYPCAACRCRMSTRLGEVASVRMAPLTGLRLQGSASWTRRKVGGWVGGVGGWVSGWVLCYMLLGCWVAALCWPGLPASHWSGLALPWMPAAAVRHLAS